LVTLPRCRQKQGFGHRYTFQQCPFLVPANHFFGVWPLDIDRATETQPLTLIDHVNGELKGDFLGQAIEQQLLEMRPLGRLKSFVFEQAVWRHLPPDAVFKLSLIQSGNERRFVSAVFHRADASEAEKHHRPRRRFGNGRHPKRQVIYVEVFKLAWVRI
jgi:hypothetical protein